MCTAAGSSPPATSSTWHSSSASSRSWWPDRSFAPGLFSRNSADAGQVGGDVDFRSSLVLFLSGFFKKACVSDNISPFVDRFFAAPDEFTAAVGLDRDPALRRPDLLRFLGLLRHGDRTAPHARVRTRRQLQLPLSGDQHPGFLAALAHFPVDAGSATTSTSPLAAAGDRSSSPTAI